MCPKPDIPSPTKFQTSKEPVFREDNNKKNKKGRSGTILTPSTTSEDQTTGSKKTALGT